MRKFITLLLALTLFTATTACTDTKKETVQTETVTITDQAGDTVTVPKNADRIAVCGIMPLPSVISVFFDGAEKLVGIPPESMTAAKNGLLGELFPEILTAATSYASGQDVNAEELMKLNPDIVFYSADNKKMGELLKNSGFTAVGISANIHRYDCIKTLNSWLDLLGQIYPENNKGEKVSAYSQEIYNLIQERTKNLKDSERKKVFFLFKYSESTIMTSGDNFFGDWWAEAVGALNVAKELKGDNQQTVNMEQIYAWNPEMIFVTNFNTVTAEDIYNNSVGSYNWSGIAAVINKQVYKMPLGMYRSYTPGTDTPVTLLWMAKQVYPELFADIDIIKETKDYYQKLFGVTLTDEQAEGIFNPSVSAGM